MHDQNAFAFDCCQFRKLNSCVPVVQPTKDSRFKLHSRTAAPFIQKYDDNEGGGPDGA